MRFACASLNRWSVTTPQWPEEFRITYYHRIGRDYWARFERFVKTVAKV